MTLSERLATHRLVTLVRYPGLTSHPTHATAKRVLKGFGTIISFDMLGGAEFADAVCRNLKLIRHATSLGAVESNIERRAAIPGQEHLPPSLLRLSVGIEDADDLWSDLVRRADAGEKIIETTEFSLTQETNEDDSNEERIEALTEIICPAGDEAAAALFVLMGTLENAAHPKLLANAAKHFAFRHCAELNLYGIVDAQIPMVEGELLAADAMS